MQLINVKDNIEELSTVMDMIYDEWGAGFSCTKEEKLSKIKTALLAGGKFPQVYILKDQDKVIGSFTFLDRELEGSTLSPWLACVVINKNLRGKGYGSILLKHIKNTIEQNFDQIYLTTKMTGFYENGRSHIWLWIKKFPMRKI